MDTSEQTKGQPFQVDPATVDKLREWLAAGRGVAIWRNVDLGSPSLGALAFTPARSREGGEVGAPHWRYGTKPEAIVESPDGFTVVGWREVRRVKVRSGPPMFGGIYRADRGKLDTALAEAGEGATWQADYSRRADGSAWFDAVISLPEPAVPLAQWGAQA